MDRVTSSASQVLSNFGAEAFERRLDETVVALAFDSHACLSREGQLSLDLCIRLLARLHPSIALVTLDTGARVNRDHLKKLAVAINPGIKIVTTLKTATACIVVGLTAPTTRVPTFFIGSKGWTALLNCVAPVGSGTSDNPFGAGAAACFAAANVFRVIFADQIQGGTTDTSISLSMRGYGQDDVDAVEDHLNDEFLNVDLGDAHLVGLGAIGHGAMWALGQISGLTGSLKVIDHDVIDLTNLQRYVLAEQAHIGTVKTAFAAEALKATALAVSQIPMRWEAYAASHLSHSYERVAVALDTAASRIAVQGSLPKWIINSWTQADDLGVSRHGFGNGSPCLACVYMPTGVAKSEDELLAEELAMPEASMEVRRFLQTNEPVPESFIARVATALSIPLDPLLPFVGQPLRTFRQQAICGGLTMRLSDGNHKAAPVVPMAFQSALAGIMLAAELVKHAAGTPTASKTATRVNLLRQLGTHLNDPRAPDHSGRCICSDKDFLKAYRHKYADNEAPIIV
jgi:molybdopterin/thiamine biosynthesis adenylyltransferase